MGSNSVVLMESNMFTGEKASIADVVNQVKLLPWSWFVAKQNKNTDINYTN